MNLNKKILILVPAFTARGGISNYYQVLQQEFPDQIEFFERGARTWPIRKGFVSEMKRAWKDYRRFKQRLTVKDISLVQTSTSVSLSTTIRDGLFVRFAKKNDIRTIVFFRGWNEKRSERLEHVIFLFRFFFFKADSFITLSEEAKNQLVKWGYKKQVYIETTLVDKKLLQNVTEKWIGEKYQSMLSHREVRLLFISRIEKYKGIYEMLSAFSILQHAEKRLIYKLIICGDGFELDNVREKIQKDNLSNVQVEGFVLGDRKREVFEHSHILIFPSHEEGMPNTVLEAMGFGIPILTTRVGGVADFFTQGENGYYIEKRNPSDIVEKLKLLLSDYELFQHIAVNNFRMANEKFRSDKVSERILHIFHSTLNTSH